MKRREFLFSLVGVAVWGMSQPLMSLPTPASSPTATPVDVAVPNFGTAYQFVGTQESTDGTYLLLNHQGWPIWLHKAKSEAVWHTATPPWHVRRMAKLLWRFS